MYDLVKLRPAEDQEPVDLLAQDSSHSNSPVTGNGGERKSNSTFNLPYMTMTEPVPPNLIGSNTAAYFHMGLTVFENPSLLTSSYNAKSATVLGNGQTNSMMGSPMQHPSGPSFIPALNTQLQFPSEASSHQTGPSSSVNTPSSLFFTGFKKQSPVSLSSIFPMAAASVATSVGFGIANLQQPGPEGSLLFAKAPFSNMTTLKVPEDKGSPPGRSYQQKEDPDTSNLKKSGLEGGTEYKPKPTSSNARLHDLLEDRKEYTQIKLGSPGRMMFDAVIGEHGYQNGKPSFTSLIKARGSQSKKKVGTQPEPKPKHVAPKAAVHSFTAGPDRHSGLEAKQGVNPLYNTKLQANDHRFKGSTATGGQNASKKQPSSGKPKTSAGLGFSTSFAYNTGGYAAGSYVPQMNYVSRKINQMILGRPGGLLSAMAHHQFGKEDPVKDSRCEVYRQGSASSENTLIEPQVYGEKLIQLEIPSRLGSEAQSDQFVRIESLRGSGGTPQAHNLLVGIPPGSSKPNPSTAHSNRSHNPKTNSEVIVLPEVDKAYLSRRMGKGGSDEGSKGSTALAEFIPTTDRQRTATNVEGRGADISSLIEEGLTSIYDRAEAKAPLEQQRMARPGSSVFQGVPLRKKTLTDSQRSSSIRKKGESNHRNSSPAHTKQPTVDNLLNSVLNGYRIDKMIGNPWDHLRDWLICSGVQGDPSGNGPGRSLEDFLEQTAER